MQNPEGGELNLFRFLKNKLFFGKSLTFKKIGFSMVTAIADEYFKEKIKKINFIKKNNLNTILNEIEKTYQSYNYLINNLNFKKKILIFFDQHYPQRKLVNEEAYFDLIKIIKTICIRNNIQFYYKAHPGSKACDQLLKLKNIKVLKSYIPAQFFQKENIIFASISSGSLVSSFSNLKLSLVNLIPFNHKQYHLSTKMALKRKILSKVYTPLNITELKNLLTKFSKIKMLKNCNFNEYKSKKTKK